MSRQGSTDRGRRLSAGDYGYIDAHKWRQLVKVILWVIVIAAIIAGGWIYTGTRFNVVTVVGIILVLPAAKALIALILVAKYHTGSREEYEKIAGLVKKNGRVLADLVLTRYEGSMYVAIAVVRGKNIFAYAPKQKTEPEKIREYLKVSVRVAGSEAAPAVYTDFQKYYEFIKKVSARENEPGKAEGKIVSDLLSRSV